MLHITTNGDFKLWKYSFVLIVTFIHFRKLFEHNTKTLEKLFLAYCHYEYFLGKYLNRIVHGVYVSHFIRKPNSANQNYIKKTKLNNETELFEKCSQLLNNETE